MKMKLRTLKILLKSSLLFFILLFYSCAPTCSQSEIEVCREAEKGNIKVVKGYIENGGDPELECHNTAGGKFGSENWLYFSICKSNSKELIEYYLTQKISDETKNKMLYFFSGTEDDAVIVKLLLKNNAHLNEYSDSCNFIEGVLIDYKNLQKLGYDFNWIDPKDGNNILLKYAKCPATDDETELVEMLKYFVEIGVKTNVKNNEGKTAYELAINEKVKEYLKNLK